MTHPTWMLLAGSAFAAASTSVTWAQPADDFSLEAQARGSRLELRLGGADTQAVTQVLIDADADPATGLSLAGAGFDLLVEGEQVHRFAGTSAQDWRWDTLGPAQRRLAGRTLTLSLDRALVPSPKAALVARTLSADYQQVLARAPRQGVLRLALDNAPATSPAPASAPGSAPGSAGREATGDADDPTRDLTDVTLTQEGGQAVVTVTMAQEADFANVLVFLARPGQSKGYRPVDAEQRFDLLINGEALLEHAGDDPAAWVWTALGRVERQRDTSRLTLRFNASLLGGAEVQAGVWSMSADWMTPVDHAPDQGLYTLTLDLSKVAPPAPAPAPIPPASPKANRDLSARQRTAQMDSFYVFYGTGQVAALSHYDLVVTHSPQMKPADIAALKDLGVVVVGYITVGEDDKLRKGDGTGPGGYASWYLDRDADGQPDQNGIWKSYFVNANDPAWRADRLAEARRLIEEEGYDGIFLDTIDTVSRFPDTEDGMVQLVADFRRELPEAVIILNQGYSVLDRLAPHADGFMLESFTATYDFASQNYMLNTPASLDWHRQNVQRYLKPVLAEHPLKILVLDYARPDDTAAIQAAADRAATFGFLFAAAPIYLDEVYPLTIRGQHDPKWLEKQATPQRLSVRLDETRNGFAQGTRVIPSGAFGGYTVATVVDGIRDRDALPWNQAAWASAEDGEEAWLAFELPEPTRGGKLVITWAKDNGVLHVSQDYQVQVRAAGEGSAWQTIGHGRGETGPVSTWPLPEKPFSAVRLIQPADGGSPTRPNLMWIAQVERQIP